MFSLILITCLVVALVFSTAVPAVQATDSEPTWTKHQLRAMWIASVVNVDWPSKTGLTKEEQQKEFLHKLDTAKSMNMNAVVVQVSPTADAFYQSNIYPWSKYLSGTQGVDPGYDPLAFMIEEAHKRNLEFHAWLNPYRISMDTNLNGLVDNHPAKQHPEWVESYGGKLYFNPGIPAVRQHIQNVIKEVTANYDVDAIHFDDYFYPYPVSGQDFPDADTFAQYGSGYTDKGDWRRNNVDLLVKEVAQAIKATKPYVKFGISPFGIWKNKRTDPAGSDTAGSESYYSIYADSRKWVKEEWLDYITPQIYWNIGLNVAAYDKLVPWWSEQVRGTKVQLYIGQASYKIAANNEAWNNPEEMPNQLRLNMNYPEVKGSIFFSAKDFSTRNPLGIREKLANDMYCYPSLVPTMPYLDNQAPVAPKLQAVTKREDGVRLHWKDTDATTTYFVVYRFPKGAKVDLNDATKIVETVRKTGKIQTYVDQEADQSKKYTYVITAVDRLHNESVASKAVSSK
ncbi:glycoside hydrolase family 10 protein [Risungbinella massiliensis]|uniref:glycoside hydrolase family 10 protein n=1 Tax=Risungbinella massiliensis TaxID=1329796 RepID=UPI0005CC7379|nr:family 10 glycosylhydrolase [Risungbinella massiliensis]